MLRQELPKVKNQLNGYISMLDLINKKNDNLKELEVVHQASSPHSVSLKASALQKQIIFDIVTYHEKYIWSPYLKPLEFAK